MTNKQYKRATIILAILIVLFIIGTIIKYNFNNEAKEDELYKVEASPEQTTEVTSKNIFSPEKKVKGDLTEYNNPRANMVLSLPTDWRINWSSDRQIAALTSKKAEIPETSFYICYDFGAQNVKSGKDFINTFKNELYKKTYTIENKRYKFYDYQEPDINTDTLFTNKHDNLVACAVTKDIRMCHDTTTSSSEAGFTKVDYYINWYDKPCVISCVVKNKYTKAAKNLLQTIASNIKYCEQKIPPTGKTASILNEFNIQLKLPYQFQLAKQDDKYLVYRSEIDNGSAYSGMALLRISYDNEEAYKINEETIATQYGYSWFKGSFMDSSEIQPTFFAEEMDSCEIGKYTAYTYDVDYTIIAKDKSYTKYFIPGETWKMKVFVLAGEKESEFIILNYQEGQEKEMKNVISLFSKTLKD